MRDPIVDRWTQAYAAVVGGAVDGDAVTCPRCGHTDLRIRYARFADSRGSAWIWSEHCRHGLRLSRVEIPEGADAFPLKAMPADIAAELDAISWDG